MEHYLRIHIVDQTHDMTVAHGANLRRVLVDAGFSPYTRLTRRANCGGRGLCATCGVWIETGEPAPAHWHDRVGAFSAIRAFHVRSPLRKI